MTRRVISVCVLSLIGAVSALAQVPPAPMPSPNAALSVTPSVISNPRRDYNPGSPVSYPDPDIITIDPAFAALRVNNTAIIRSATGETLDKATTRTTIDKLCLEIAKTAKLDYDRTCVPSIDKSANVASLTLAAGHDELYLAAAELGRSPRDLLAAVIADEPAPLRRTA